MKIQDLLESLDTPYSYEDEYTNPNAWGAAFYAADQTLIKVSADNQAVEFYRKHEQGPTLWEISFSRNGQDNVTGGGDEQRIFATVIAIIRQYSQKYNMSFMIVGASKRNSNRGKLYGRMIARYAPQAGYINVPNFATDSRVPDQMKDYIKTEIIGQDVFLLMKQ